MVKALRSLLALLLFACAPLVSSDVLVEFKAAYFMPTDSDVKKIYGKGGALFGPEVTFRVYENWYGFASIDFLTKKGHSLGLCDRTTMSLMPLGIGVKYLIPFCYGDFYMGLGFQPLRLKTVNCSPDVDQTTTNWGFGGIAKIGSYFTLPDNYFIDLFIDYSFVKVGCKKCSPLVVPLKANLNGAIFGAGLGYRFN